MSITDPRVAARAQLATFLRAQLTDITGLTVQENWPIPQTLLAVPAITVISSAQIQAEYHNPRLWSVTPTTGVNATALYSYGRAEINLQLDVWSDFEATRDVLAARLETELNRDPLETLSPDPTRPVGFKRKPGLVITLDDYYGTPCEFIFTQPPGLNESARDLITTSISPSVTADWRSTFTGRAILYLMDQDTVALMKTVTMQLGMNGDPIVDVPLAT